MSTAPTAHGPAGSGTGTAEGAPARRMILTVTPNPSLDRTIELTDELRRGEVQRAARTTDEPGGKGVNVSRALAASGAETVALLPGLLDDPVLTALRQRGVPTVNLPIEQRLRANVTVTEPGGTTTKINEVGPDLGAHVEALTGLVVEHAPLASWLVLAGSLPPGVPASFYADLVAAVRERWAADAPRIAVDASGAALAEVVATARPDLIKPNHEELAELVGEDAAGDLDVITEATRRAHQLVPEHVASALVTLGADGALLFTAEGAWRGYAPKIQVASTVGAGDSSLAGYLLADLEGASAPDRLARSIAYGAAAATLPGTQPPTPADLPAGPIAVSVFSTPTATS